ncbi:MAG: DUF4282 domain-containing protein [Halothiobacillaceae bacterium]|nr:MAG: DUF4282 domain-containing protein [Halothiobacillaceae bacterium]
MMDTIFDDIVNFLTFQRLIAPYALIVFYWLGAFGMPLLAWWAMLWGRQRLPFFAPMMDGSLGVMRMTLTARQRFMLGMMFACGFLMMELFWRMMFEFMLAYFQIHEALTKVVPGQRL